MGGKPLRHDPLFQTRLAGELALRVVHQALPVTTYRQIWLSPCQWHTTCVYWRGQGETHLKQANELLDTRTLQDHPHHGFDGQLA